MGIYSHECKITIHELNTIGSTISVRQAVIAACDACVRQACLPAIATSSFKIFLTQSFPRRGATCYILPSRAMSQLFNGVNSLSLNLEHLADMCEF